MLAKAEPRTACRLRRNRSASRCASILRPGAFVQLRAAATEVGSEVVQLLALWRAGRHEAALRAFWPEAVARFSPVGMVCVVVLVVGG